MGPALPVPDFEKVQEPEESHMLKFVGAAALLGVVTLGAVGGTAALAASSKPSAAQAQQAKKDKAAAAGTIIKLSDQEMTIERVHRDKTTKAPVKDDLTFELNASTAVHRAGDRNHRLGLDALKVGQDVRVRFVTNSGKKAARAVVILPDHRAGHLVSKDADGKSFMIRTADGNTVHVTTGDKTRFVEGVGKNRKAGSYADLKVGDRVIVIGQEDSQHNFDAAVVRSANADRTAQPGPSAAP
jgi:hypothetical protein